MNKTEATISNDNNNKNTPNWFVCANKKLDFL